MNREPIRNIIEKPIEYVKPSIEIIEIENEGILAASGESFGFDDGYNGWA